MKLACCFPYGAAGESPDIPTKRLSFLIFQEVTTASTEKSLIGSLAIFDPKCTYMIEISVQY